MLSSNAMRTKMATFLLLIFPLVFVVPSIMAGESINELQKPPSLTKKEAQKRHKKITDQGNAGTEYVIVDVMPAESIENILKAALEGNVLSAKDTLALVNAAEQGNANVQRSLGRMYYSGRGVQQDYKEAIKWYTKAAEQGNTAAQFLLGGMYERGEGVPQNYVYAYAWTNLAASDKKADFIGGMAIGRDALLAKMTPEQIAKGQELSSQLFHKINKQD